MIMTALRVAAFAIAILAVVDPALDHVSLEPTAGFAARRGLERG